VTALVDAAGGDVRQATATAAALLTAAEDVTLLAHVRPDADALGSALRARDRAVPARRPGAGLVRGPGPRAGEPAATRRAGPVRARGAGRRRTPRCS
jgi:phosphoesterase RecJ-like protein